MHGLAYFGITGYANYWTDNDCWFIRDFMFLYVYQGYYFYNSHSTKFSLLTIIQAELANCVGSTGLLTDIKHMYFSITPTGVVVSNGFTSMRLRPCRLGL